MEEKAIIESLLKTQLFDIETLRTLKMRALILQEYELATKIIVEERRIINLSNISRLDRLGLNIKSDEIDNKK
jgi:hypothetical protein